jgi:hypothetical protein
MGGKTYVQYIRHISCDMSYDSAISLHHEFVAPDGEYWNSGQYILYGGDCLNTTLTFNEDVKAGTWWGRAWQYLDGWIEAANIGLPVVE